MHARAQILQQMDCLPRTFLLSTLTGDIIYGWKFLAGKNFPLIPTDRCVYVHVIETFHGLIPKMQGPTGAPYLTSCVFIFSGTNWPSNQVAAFWLGYDLLLQGGGSGGTLRTGMHSYCLKRFAMILQLTSTSTEIVHPQLCCETVYFSNLWAV